MSGHAVYGLGQHVATCATSLLAWANKAKISQIEDCLGVLAHW